MSDPELKMTIKTLAHRGVPNRQIARQLALSEGAVRYHLKRIAAGTPDGRARQRRLAAEVADAIAYWHDTMSIANTAELHAWLVAEHDYGGSLRSVQRFVAEHYPRPARRTRRRVETPPGAQAQVDWGHFPGAIVDGCFRRARSAGIRRCRRRDASDVGRQCAATQNDAGSFARRRS